MIPMYRLYLSDLYGIYGPRCPLFSKRPLNQITHSLCLNLYIICDLFPDQLWILVRVSWKSRLFIDFNMQTSGQSCVMLTIKYEPINWDEVERNGHKW